MILGTDKFMHKEGIPHSDAFCETVGTTVHVTVAGQYRGYLIVADRIKPQSAQAIRELRQLGIEKLVMLSGDDESVAVNVGRELGLDEVHAELLPEVETKCGGDPLSLAMESMMRLSSAGRTLGSLWAVWVQMQQLRLQMW